MKKLFVYSLFFLIFFTTYSQFLNTEKYLHADEKMVLNVKQFSQFVSRFNYKEDFSGNPITQEFKTNFPRQVYIGYLFNVKDPRLNEQNTDNENYQKTVKEFIDKVVADSLKIKRFSEKNYVEAKCDILFKSQKRELILILRPEHVNDGVKWVIADVLNIEDIILKNVDVPEVFIPPTSNELNFTHLKRAFEDKDNFYNYYSDEYQQNPMNRLNHEVEQGNIVFNHVTKLTYNIFEIDGWIIKVEEFIRDDINSGWLISNIEKTNLDEKTYFRRETR